MKIRLLCRDGYEAQKLAGVLGNEIYETLVTGILDVFGNEVVVSLRDGSAHSIILADGEQVDAFADFMQSVLEGCHRISNSTAAGNELELLKE